MEEIVTVTKMAFEKHYSDGSGVEFSVALNNDEIVFESIDSVSFPIEQLDFIISSLTRIRKEIV